MGQDRLEGVGVRTQVDLRVVVRTGLCGSRSSPDVLWQVPLWLGLALYPALTCPPPGDRRIAGLDVDFSLESPQGVLLVSESRKADSVHT